MESEDDRKAFEEFKKMRAGAVSHVEIRPESNPPKPPKEKKPRSEKQQLAFQKMREALQKKRENGVEVKNEVSKGQKAKLDKAYEEAEKVKEILPLANVVVKSSKGRPRGSKNSRPTPAYESDPELEDMPPLEPIEETAKVLPKKKAVKPAVTVQDQMVHALKHLAPEDQMSVYMRKLNGR
jgi:hypothetical protein